MKKINVTNSKEKKIFNVNNNSHNCITKIMNDFKIRNNNSKNNSGKRDTITKNTSDLISQILNVDNTKIFEKIAENPKRKINRKIKEKKINLNKINISEIHRCITNNEIVDKENKNKNKQISSDIKTNNIITNSTNSTKTHTKFFISLSVKKCAYLTESWIFLEWVFNSSQQQVILFCLILSKENGWTRKQIDGKQFLLQKGQKNFPDFLSW